MERNIEKRKELLTFIVAGGGFTGIETVGELIDAKKVLCPKYNVDQKSKFLACCKHNRIIPAILIKPKLIFVI